MQKYDQFAFQHRNRRMSPFLASFRIGSGGGATSVAVVPANNGPVASSSMVAAAAASVFAFFFAFSSLSRAALRFAADING